MILAHRIKLDPTFRQREYFVRACAASRFVWNWGLEEWNRLYRAGEKTNINEISRKFTVTRREWFSWLKNIHSGTQYQTLNYLQAAFGRFFKKKARYPRFKSRKRSKNSFYVQNSSLKLVGRSVRLPLVGWIRMRQELRFEGRVLSATVSETAGNWYVSINVDVGDLKRPRTGSAVVGVDLGVKCLAVLSTGERIESPRFLEKSLKRLRLLNRRLARKKRGSKNREKARRRLACLHMKITNARRDFLNKLTTRLCRENQAVGIEDLSVGGMLSRRSLSRRVSDAGFFEFKRQMTYKAELHDTRLTVADRFYPSSKTCSWCGHVKVELSLDERTFVCSRCGLEIDRDLNASLNLKNLCTVGLTGSDACGQGGAGSSAVGLSETNLVEAGTRSQEAVYASAN